MQDGSRKLVIHSRDLCGGAAAKTGSNPRIPLSADCSTHVRVFVCDNYPIHTSTQKLGSMHTNLRQRQQLAHSTEDQRTFVYLPYLQVVVTESG